MAWLRTGQLLSPELGKSDPGGREPGDRSCYGNVVTLRGLLVRLALGTRCGLSSTETQRGKGLRGHRVSPSRPGGFLGKKEVYV